MLVDGNVRGGRSVGQLGWERPSLLRLLPRKSQDFLQSRNCFRFAWLKEKDHRRDICCFKFEDAASSKLMSAQLALNALEIGSNAASSPSLLVFRTALTGAETATFAQFMLSENLIWK
uniref:Uncharacterized protein n=1 Tax=Melanopsichium pennsylvanicum 4 TaxID=1398559 RepID=A0A077QRT5_9BASI|nr:uncharacterized protein BN887_06058 [Melanopsichium pennsylvanicum 4]